MIGIVTPDLQAVVHLRVRGAHSEEIETVVDTGFNGFLTLPPNVIARLALSFVGTTRVGLGDGRDVEMRYFKAFISWNGEDRAVEVLESDGGALIGMAMLRNCELKIEVVDGGAVSIETITNRTNY